MKKIISLILCLLFIPHVCFGGVKISGANFSGCSIGGARDVAASGGFIGDNVLSTATGASSYGTRCKHSPFVATTSGPINYIHVWTGNVGSAGNMNAAIYASTAGSPLRDSTLQSISADGVYNFQLDSEIEITASTTYRLGANSSQNWKFKENNGDNMGHNDFSVSDTMGNITVNSDSSATKHILIWADNNAIGTTV